MNNLNEMLASSEGRKLIEELEKFKEGKKERVFELLKEDANKAVLERHVILGIESVIEYIELLKKAAEIEREKKKK